MTSDKEIATEQIKTELRLIREENLRIAQQLRSLSDRQEIVHKRMAEHIDLSVRRQLQQQQRHDRFVRVALLAIILLLISDLFILRVFL